MDTVKKPSTEDLRKAQAALDALNVAYEYFTPAPYVAGLGTAVTAEAAVSYYEAA